MIFGNIIRHWSVEEFRRLKAGEVPPLISARSRGAAQSSVQRYRMVHDVALIHVNKLINEGVPESDIILDESAPDNKVVLQCEVMNSPNFIDMRYALHNIGNGMRHAYGIMKHTYGAVAMRILRDHLDGPSMENLEYLLDVYNESVIELSAYSVSVGVLGWNSLTWEVRNDQAPRYCFGQWEPTVSGRRK